MYPWARKVMVVNPVVHYLKPSVVREISEWLRGRWIALEGFEHGKRVFIRYDQRGRPLSISSQRDFEQLVLRYRGRFRTIYGSLNIYQKLEHELDTDILTNIVATTPAWDIDSNDISLWRGVVEIAKIVIDALRDYGVEKSVYLVWSGRGVHIHINENALSPQTKSMIHPFDVAYAVVEYILRIARPRIKDVIARYPGIKVENVVDLKRVFTAPLSLHRQLDVVAICMKPDDLDSFDISWINPENYRHREFCWREYVVGELDDLASKAVKEVGLKSLQLEVPRVRRSAITFEDIVEGRVVEEPRIGRFEVMALLQAARYYVLTGDLDRAKSFGLNRAIFYAWAKYYGPHGKRSQTKITGRAIARSTSVRDEDLGEDKEKRFAIVFGTEKVPVSSRGWFEMGGQEQLPEDFDRQIVSKLEVVAPWDEIWRKTIEYVEKFPQHILRDPQKFYKYVYEPVRDSFVEKVLKVKDSKHSGGLLAYAKREKRDEHSR